MSDINRAQIGFISLLKISVPIMVGGLSMTLVNLTDTAFLARLGESELGGAGNAGLLFFLLVVIGMGFATGSQILIGRRNGERKYELIGHLVQHCLLFLLVYGTLLYLILRFVIGYLVPHLVDSEDVGIVIVQFLETRSWGIYFNYINLAFMIFYVGITKTRIIGIVTPLISILNIVLDYGLIFGNLGMPQMGVEGAALASNISEMAGSILLLAYTFIFFKNSEYQLFRKHPISIARYKSIFQLSVPIMIQNFLSITSWFVFFSIIEHMGEAELAASHIVRSLYMVLIIPVFAMGDTSNSLTSNLIGQKNVGLVLPMLRNISILAFATMALLQPIYYVFGKSLFLPFTSSEQIIELGDPVMQVVFTALFPFAIAIMGFRMISGAGKTLVALLIEVFVVSIYLCLAWFISTLPGIQLYQVWLMEFVYFGLFCLLVYAYIWKGNWRESNI
ncbi:MAG: MATE family efflux transporter [Flavobacteriales bacterium]|nr:MATE family efflux transporter [Flavobacteriales bacterium]